MLVRQLEEELRMRMRQPNIEMQQQMEAIFAENEHLTREIAILRDTIKVCWPNCHVGGATSTKRMFILSRTLRLIYMYIIRSSRFAWKRKSRR